MKLSIAEILTNTEKLEDYGQKIDYLRKNDSAVLRQMLTFAFDHRIEWELPPGKPPYRPSEALDQEGMLFKEMKRMYLFLKGGHPTLTQIRRENLYIQLLEAIPQPDAELLLAVKDHQMPYNVSEDLVRDAFPDLLTFPPTVKEVVQSQPEKKEKKKDPTFGQRMKEAREKKKQQRKEENLIK